MDISDKESSHSSGPRLPALRWQLFERPGPPFETRIWKGEPFEGFRTGGCDTDITFCAAALATWGPYLQYWRKRQEEAMAELQVALTPIEVWAAKQMCAEVATIASNSRPGYMAVLTTILRLPDRTQARGYVTGMRISGEIDETGIFRVLRAKELHPEVEREKKQEAYFGEAAEIAVDKLLKSKPPKEAELILNETRKEQERG